METSAHNTASQSSMKNETETNNKVSRQAKAKDSIKPEQKVQKSQTDLAVHNSRIDFSDTNAVSTSETEINNKILEVFRQAKEIIEHYSNQKVITTL